MPYSENLFDGSTTAAAGSASDKGVTGLTYTAPNLTAALVDGTTQSVDLTELDDAPTIEQLVVTARNVVQPLSATPTSPVEFHVNGDLVTAGITNAGAAVTIDRLPSATTSIPALMSSRQTSLSEETLS